MGRRKKEEPSFHRECIATAAEQLFLEKGILTATMDDIAKAAKYSKATLYVYFRDKEEIVGALALKSMRLLHERIAAGIEQCNDAVERYKAICKELTGYQEEYPLYFQLALGEINVDFDAPNAMPIERDIFEMSELIMGEISGFLQSGIAEKTLQEDIAYCKGCMACKKTGVCTTYDDISAIRQSLISCDIAVIACPAYFANVTAPLKNMFDRLVAALMDDNGGTSPRQCLKNAF